MGNSDDSSGAPRDMVSTPLTDAKTKTLSKIVENFENGHTVEGSFVPTEFAQELERKLKEWGFDSLRSHHRARQAEMDRDDAFAYIHELWRSGRLPDPMNYSLRTRVLKWGDPTQP